MTVKKDLEKALAAAESAKGTYASFGTATDDKTAQQMFQAMSKDMDQHISNIQSRLSTTSENQLNSISTSTASATTSNQQENFQ
jgi:D-Tyr-tRNAtyr deacylase